MRRRTQAAITLVGLTLLATLVYGVSQHTVRFPTTAVMKSINVGVFWNKEATQTVVSIDWGVIEPGQVVSKTVYIQNQANVPTFFTLSTEQWNPPEAATYISLNWNYTGKLVAISEIVPVALTLSVSPSISSITNFSFMIVITAIG